jgi:hypothetical protein
MNSQLKQIYKKSKGQLVLSSNILDKVSPPLLLRVTTKYERADINKRVIVFGQETQGWGCIDTIGFKTFSDFEKTEEGVEKLCNLYEGFCFGKYSDHKKSPFWRAFRQIANMVFGQEYFESETIWNNLVKVDYDRASIKKLPWEEQVKCLEYSRQILLNELEVLKPKTCILFTGPNYDSFLYKVFGNVELTPVMKDYSGRQLSTFYKDGIRYFRTYHPSYLQRAGLWRIVDVIRNNL